jgi:hypothetical protein
MKKIYIITGIILVVLALATWGIYTEFTKGYEVNETKFYTYNLDDLQKELSNQKHKDGVFADEETDKNYVTYTFDLSSLDLGYNLKTFLNLIKGKNNYSADYTIKIDKDKLKTDLEEHNNNCTKSENACIIKGEDLFEIQDEVQGNEYDINAILEDLTDTVKSFNLEDYLVLPTVTSEDLKDKLNEINKYASWSITYTNGDIVKADIDYIDLDEDYNVILTSDDYLDDIVKDITYKYDDTYESREFKTHSGNTISVVGGIWGTLTNTEEEVKTVKELYQSGESQSDRFPEYYYSHENIGNTYVEVSIQDQYMWVYENGSVVLESDIVTGNPTLGRDTPTGIYYIMERINGKYLTGENYKTWVDYWMRITYTGVGFHDASWQSSFGGSRYKTNGSHGCINLPVNIAKQLIDIVYVDEPVIVY